MPLTLDVALGFAASFGGILVMLFSRNVRVKRVVLPIMLVVFHLVVFIGVQRGGARVGLPTPVLVALLALNALYVFRVVGYCRTCGRTVQGSVTKHAAVQCPECALANVR